MNITLWLRALRVKFISASIIPVLLGNLVAWSTGDSINILYFILTLIGVVSIHLGSNLANDYFDFKSGADKLNKSGSESSGGSGVIQEGLISPKRILNIAYILFLIGIIIGLFLGYELNSRFIIILTLLGGFIGYFYTANPIKLSYKGFAELSNGLIFGPLIGVGSFYVQSRSLALKAVIPSIIPGILLALVLIINEFPDLDSDREVGKKTLIVRFNRSNGRWIFISSLVFVYLYLIVAVLFNIIPFYSLIALFTIPIAVKIIINVKNFYNDFSKLKPANIYMIQLHLFFGLLLALGYVLKTLL